MILGLSTDAKSSSLYVGEDYADEFTKRRRVENRHSLRPTHFSITTVHPVSSYGTITLPAVFTQPRPESEERGEKWEMEAAILTYQIMANTCFTFSALPPAPSCFITSAAICFKL